MHIPRAELKQIIKEELVRLIKEAASLRALSGFKKLEDFKWDGTHVLPGDAAAAGYRITLEQIKTVLKVRLFNPVGKNIGILTAKLLNLKNKTGLSVEDVKLIDAAERGRGFGRSMYEAVYAYAFNNLNVEIISGGEHSSAAAGVHKSLASKYGFAYEPGPGTGKKGGEYDRAAGKYRYKLQ